MSVSLLKATAAFFSASIPATVEPGPAKIARGRCLLLYSTGKATAKTTGGFALDDWSVLARTTGSRRSAALQGSAGLWLTRACERRKIARAVEESVVIFIEPSCLGFRIAHRPVKGR